MKDTNRRPAWRIRLTIFATVLGLLLTLLAGCSRKNPEQTAPGSEATDPVTTAPSTEQTAPATEPTTEPATEPVTEPTTEPATEPTTEPATEPATEPTTEPATEPTQAPSGSSTPGGTSGYIPGGSTDSDTEEQPEPEAFVPPAPGTAGNPYVEDLPVMPDSIQTVTVPAGGSICYEIFAQDSLILTLEAADAYIVHKDVTYTPDENGLISLNLTPAVFEDEENNPETETEETEAPETPVEPEDWFVVLPFAVGSNSESGRSFLLSFTETLGGATNPEILAELGTVTATLEAGDRNGYHYQWAATVDDSITFTIDSVAPETATADLVVTCGEQVYSLVKDSTVNELQKTELTVDVLAGDTLLIQVITNPDEKGEYPAAEVTFQAASVHAVGSEINPVKVSVEQVPFEIVTIPVPAGEGSEVWYEAIGAAGCLLTVEDKDAYIIYGGNRYDPDENGIITVELKGEAGRVPVVFQVGNAALEEKTFLVKLNYPEGGAMAPVELEDISAIEAVTGADGSVCYSWTATATGVLQLEVFPDAFDVALNNTTIGSYRSLSADGVYSEMGTYVYNYVRQGDVVQILVTANDGTAGYATTMLGYVLGNEEAPLFVTDSLLQLPIAGGGEILLNAYCHEQTMIVSSDSVYIIFNGQRYEPTNGVVSLTFPANTETIGRPMPLAVTVGNSSENVVTYEIKIEAPLGSALNPQPIKDFNELFMNIPEGDTDGMWFYTWTATGTGILHADIYNPTEGVDFDITIYNPATGSYMTYAEDVISDELGNALRIYVREGDVLDIQVSVSGEMDKNQNMVYPAFDCTISGYLVGTEESPMFLGQKEFMLPLASESRVYVKGYCYASTMTITGEGAYVEFNGSRVDAEEGVLTITFPENTVTVGRPQPLEFVIGCDAEYAVKYAILLEAPLGTRENPEELELPGEVTVALEEGNSEGWYYKWTALENGTVTFRILQVTEKTEGDIVLTNNTTGLQTTLSGSDAVSLNVAAGDEIIIQLVAVPDPKDWSYPATEIIAAGVFDSAEN